MAAGEEGAASETTQGTGKVTSGPASGGVSLETDPPGEKGRDAAAALHSPSMPLRRTSLTAHVDG